MRVKALAGLPLILVFSRREKGFWKLPIMSVDKRVAIMCVRLSGPVQRSRRWQQREGRIDACA